ncbi:hypothetical protein ACFRIC_41625 [Streptomyces sp. NPDC056738]|uniref:hypothetical protein n=1 Tax=Streptomyces sp. NPDC056738 TaxID=3345933 RepID=UPI0036B415D1
MSSDTFKIMRWNADFDGPWGAPAAVQYRSGGFDGLSLTSTPEWKPESIGFISELLGLRYLNLRVKISQDLDVFQINTLEDLSLLTGSRRKIPNVVLPQLRSLCLTDRPGIEMANQFPQLEHFQIGTWKGSDLEMVRGGGCLKSLYLEGRRQAGTLAGIETCPAVEEIMSVNYSIADSSPLRPLDRLREVKLLAASPAAPHGIIRFSDIASSDLAKVWISNAPVLQDVDALRELPRLREVRLIECRLGRDDLQELKTLPGRVDVRIISPRG